MSTDWESLSKKQRRLAFITVIMECAEKFDNDTIDDCLETLYKNCITLAELKNIKISVPFPTEEKES